jgi:predicted RNA binding protein YcfA (HicA-like mRNA interferase family)
MKYLFVDYDQGAGGEFFCANLSLSPQCCVLESTMYANGRTKIKDMFDQEFLKVDAVPDISKLGHVDLYNVVPTHRHTDLAKKLLQNVKSVRIKSPVDEKYWKFLKHQQLIKVLLANEPTDEYFIGLIRNIQKETGNSEFIKKIKRNMDILNITLLSRNIEPTEKNRQAHIQKIYNLRIPEPNFDYDLTIPYEDLFERPKTVEQKLFDIFGIKLHSNWLSQYQQNYATYLAQT